MYDFLHSLKVVAHAGRTYPQKSRTPPHRGALPFLCCPPRPREQKSSKKNSHPYTSGVRCGMIPIDSGISGRYHRPESWRRYICGVSPVCSRNTRKK